MVKYNIEIIKEQAEKIECLEKEIEEWQKGIMYQGEKAERLEKENEQLRLRLDDCAKCIHDQQREIEEHCETKGLLGRQVFTLTKRVDEQIEKIDELEKENEQLKILLNAEKKTENYLLEKIKDLQKRMRNLTEEESKLHYKSLNKLFKPKKDKTLYETEEYKFEEKEN